MQQRRRKVPGTGTSESKREITADDDPGSERWDGDPEEEPAVEQAAEPAAKDRFPKPWGLVITDVYRLDVHRTYEKLERELTLGDGATEYGTVLKALDASAKNLYLAARLARAAKNEDEKFTTELDKRLEVLRSAAIHNLEEEKKQGARSKAPTIDDINNRMLADYPDEYTSIKARKAEMHGAFRAIEALEGAWRERCQALRVIALQFKSAGA